MCLFCGSPEPLHLGWIPLAIGAFGYYKGRQAIRRAEQAKGPPLDAESSERSTGRDGDAALQ